MIRTRDWLTLCACLTMACAGPVAEKKLTAAPALVISADGHTAIVNGQSWTAPEGTSFFARGDEIHAVSMMPDRTFDVAAQVHAGQPLVWPENPYFEAVAGALRIKQPSAPKSIAVLLDSGQVNVHGNHLHLTHLYENAALQALFRAREDTSPFSPLDRETAASILADLLEMRISATNEDEALKSLHRANEIIDKVYRGFVHGLTPAQLESIVLHNYEILDEGRRINIEGQGFTTEGPLRFAYCGKHFHVESTQGQWAQIIEFPEDAEPGRFAFPRSIFFNVGRDGVLVEKQSPARWRALMKSDQLRMRSGHWHLSEKYMNKDLSRLKHAMDDVGLPEKMRADAQSRMLAVLLLRIGMGSERDLDDSLEQADRAIAAEWADFKAKWKRGSA
jgi:hypothetical protein